MNNKDKSEQKNLDTTQETFIVDDTTRSVSNDETDSGTNENDSSLQALINQEQSQPREHLLEELGREPTQEEIDRWLSAHTEGH